MLKLMATFLLATSPQSMTTPENAVAEYTARFVAGDGQRILALWDDQEPDEVTYVGAELPGRLLGKAELANYYALLTTYYTVHSGVISNLSINQRGGQAYAYFLVDWTYSAKAGGPVLGFQARITLLMKKRGHVWQYQHMHESVTWTPST